MCLIRFFSTELCYLDVEREKKRGDNQNSLEENVKNIEHPQKMAKLHSISYPAIAYLSPFLSISPTHSLSSKIFVRERLDCVFLTRGATSILRSCHFMLNPQKAESNGDGDDAETS